MSVFIMAAFIKISQGGMAATGNYIKGSIIIKVVQQGVYLMEVPVLLNSYSGASRLSL